MIPTTLSPQTARLRLAGFDCGRRSFRFDIFGRHDGDAHIERDQAVAAAINILGVASLFGGLSKTERARLATLLPTPTI